MNRSLHSHAFALTVPWTLGLLLLGSVVHATESSLACPDWPTCFGTMMPEMTGGVFWEHLHRLVAGALILLFGAGAALAWRQEPRRWVVRAAGLGVALLLLQAVLGGVTVLLRLPTAVSSAHLALAFVFLALAVVLATVTSPRWGTRPGPEPAAASQVRRWAVGASVLVFVQSLLGAMVRHAEAGMACPDIPLCMGGLVPPAWNHLVGLHWSHRVLGLMGAGVVMGLVAVVLRRTPGSRVRGLAVAAGTAVWVQVALGFASVGSTLAVVPVSLHTLVAAILLTATVALAVHTWESPAAAGPRKGSPVLVGEGTGGR